MNESHIDRDNLQISGRHEALRGAAHLGVSGAADGVEIIVTHAYGPGGDDLVGRSGISFDGYPAVTLLVRAGDREGLVHLSPIHGDARKTGFTDIEPGTRCELLCPVTRQPLDPVEGAPGYRALYLTPQRSMGSIVALCEVWGQYQSRILHDFDLISAWAVDD